jgi:hypothetical protein
MSVVSSLCLLCSIYYCEYLDKLGNLCKNYGYADNPIGQ